MSLTIVILAAGKGTRMKSNLPKIMHPIAGFPMVEYLLDVAHEICADDIRLVLSNEIAQYLDKNPLSKDYNYRTIIQKDLIGTANAVSCAIDTGPTYEQVLVLYADAPLINSSVLKSMIEIRVNNIDMSIVNLGFHTDIPHGYGRMITIDDYLIDIVEEKSADAHQKEINLCNSGIMLGDAKILKELLPKITNDNAAKEYYLTDVIRMANQSGYNCGYTVADELEVMGVNSQHQLAEVNFIIQTRLRQQFMNDGVMMIDPHSVFLSKDTIIGRGVVIEPGVYIGPNVSIADNCTIKSHSYIEGAVIESGCVIGPFARIRPQTKLDTEVHIGNFVEVKNSHLASGVKAGHLSYIGDAEVGEDSNIGAGTVFCNYDGIKKQRTTVGNEVFIGSNVAIVSPCVIGDHALIAAGSVVTEDVAKNDLVIARNKQSNFSGKGMVGRKKGDKD